MTPEQFIATWKDNPLSERAGAQAHFDDLCDLLGVDKPCDPDHYCFERGAKKSTGGDGWADVWKRGHFGWENKKPARRLIGNWSGCGGAKVGLGVGCFSGVS